MIKKEKLYEAFGEIIYAVAKADGIVQDEEVEKLHELVEGYEWAEDAVWSFNYENTKNHDFKDAYEKALAVFEEYGPHEDYATLLKVLEEVAKASDGIDDHERRVIENFKKDLRKLLR
jgi:uncharacterized tellurite resistance protein B-like protein